MTPPVTVVMPLYNKATYVAEAIQSLLDQTFENFELVIVDDASTDKSLDIAKQFKDDRIRILRNNSRRGVNFTRNRGIEEATTKYIALLDGDDVYRATKLEKQIELTKDFPQDVIYTDYLRINPNGLLEKKEVISLEGFAFPRLLRSGGNGIPALPTLLYQKADYQKAGRYPEDITVSGDYDFALRLSLIRPFHFVREPLYLWRTVADSVFHSKVVPIARRYEIYLRTISENYDLGKSLLNTVEATYVQNLIARYCIASRSYGFAMKAALTYPWFLGTLISCLREEKRSARPGRFAS